MVIWSCVKLRFQMNLKKVNKVKFMFLRAIDTWWQRQSNFSLGMWPWQVPQALVDDPAPSHSWSTPTELTGLLLLLMMILIKGHEVMM